MGLWIWGYGTVRLRKLQMTGRRKIRIISGAFIKTSSSGHRVLQHKNSSDFPTKSTVVMEGNPIEVLLYFGFRRTLTIGFF